MISSPTAVTAVRASAADATEICRLLASGPRPIMTSVEQVSGTLQDGCCFLLRLGGETLGFVELRAIRSIPGRDDAAAVLWVISPKPVGLGVATLSFLLRYAFDELQLREVWGWVRDDNASMLTLCRRLDIADNGPWNGDPEFRLMTCSAEKFAEMRAILMRVETRVRVPPVS